MGSMLVYAGFAGVGAGFVSLVRPLRFLGIRSRLRAALVATVGLLVVGAGMALPAPLRRAEGESLRLDRFAPAFQFHEVHSTLVKAPAERVWAAIKAVTAREIRLFRLLTWLRSPRLPGSEDPESILNPAADRPILEVATSSGFVLLADEPPRELVLGTLVVAPSERAPIETLEDFAGLSLPGYAKAAMNFHLEAAAPGATRLTTETRVFATDAGSRRRFAAYWRVIYPGSSLLRVQWLKAIKRRAEAG
jgi:hypothetical protein